MTDTSPATVTSTTTLTSTSALEFELRRMPGVVFVGIEDRGDVLAVQIAAPGLAEPGALRPRAEQLCRGHLRNPFVLDVIGGERPARVRLMGVDIGVDRVVVLVDYRGRQAEASSASGDPTGPATATIRALTDLGVHVPFDVDAAAVFEHRRGDGVMLVLNSPEDGERYGVATGSTPEAAAARATLNALNRYLAAQTIPV